MVVLVLLGLLVLRGLRALAAVVLAVAPGLLAQRVPLARRGSLDLPDRGLLVRRAQQGRAVQDLLALRA